MQAREQRSDPVETTLAIDDDVLAAAKALADRQDRSIGEVISDLARQSLGRSKPSPRLSSGIRTIPLRPDSKPVTLEIVNALRDELP